MNKILFSILCFVSVLGLQAQQEKEYEVSFSPVAKNDSTIAEVESVITFNDSIIALLIKFYSTEPKSFHIPKVSVNSNLVAGEDIFKVYNIIALEKGTLEPTKNNLFGIHYWDTIEKDEEYHFFAMYSGKLKKGVSKLSIVNTEEDSDKYYTFKDIEIENSLTNKSYYFLGHTTSNVNLRQGPSTETEKLGTLNPGMILYTDLHNEENNFYKVEVISTGQTGYVHKNYVKLTDKTTKMSSGGFKKVREKGLENPKISVYNRSEKTMTLTIGDKKFIFSPYQRKTVEIQAGSYICVASAVNVTSYTSRELLLQGGEYEWEFYIITKIK